MKNNFIKKLFVVFTFFVQWIVLPSYDTKDEYTIKALFVYNFTKYIEWNEQSLPQQFRIGVYGESEISEKLSQIVKGKKLYNRTIELKALKTIDDAAGYQIVYIVKDQGTALQILLDKYSGTEMLLITEEKNMGIKGAGINIIEKDQRMKFELNESAIKKSGLKVSSQLYDLAIVIK